MPNGPIEKILQSAEMELSHMSSTPFSPAAFGAIKSKVSMYVAELIAESVRIGRRHKADTVSAAHVDQAADILVADSGKRLFRHLGTIGGILLGAAIGNLLAMISSNQFTILSVSATAGMGVVGAFMIALYIAKD